MWSRNRSEPLPVAPTRQVVAAAITLLALGAVGAIQAGASGRSFMYELELVVPPLARVDPVIDPLPTRRITRRVYLVIIDGLRVDKSYQLPFLDELRRTGVDGEASSHYPTLSRPNYVSILTGVPPTASGVRTNFHSTPVVLDTLMDRARAAGLRVATATDYSPLPKLFLRPMSALRRPPLDIAELETEADIDREPDEDRPSRGIRAPDAELASPFDDARYAPWPGGFREAGAALVAGNADLVIMLIGAVDIAGHDRGAASTAERGTSKRSGRRPQAASIGARHVCERQRCLRRIASSFVREEQVDGVLGQDCDEREHRNGHLRQDLPPGCGSGAGRLR